MWTVKSLKILKHSPREHDKEQGVDISASAGTNAILARESPMHGAASSNSGQLELEETSSLFCVKLYHLITTMASCPVFRTIHTEANLSDVR